MNEIDLEHRLTKLEEAVVSTQHSMEQGFTVLTEKAERQQAVIDRILVQTTATNSRVTKLEGRPLFDISNEEARDFIRQHRDIWSVWRFSRWFIPLSVPLAVAITTLLADILIHVL